MGKEQFYRCHIKGPQLPPPKMDVINGPGLVQKGWEWGHHRQGEVWYRTYGQKLPNPNWWTTQAMAQMHCLQHLFCITNREKVKVNCEPWSLTIKKCNIIGISMAYLLWSHMFDTHTAKQEHTNVGEGIFNMALDYSLLQSCATMTARPHASCC